jgi:nicotinate-nucleotide--dimethylbenzimidazole phosphoribosyltransferase
MTALTEILPTPALIEPLADAGLAERVQHAIDQKTKPLGSLGRIEALALQLATIVGQEQPWLQAPQLVVFAADHGLARRGVSAYPPEVTAQMVLNFMAGGAAVSVLARQHGLALTVVDCGVAHDFAPQHGLHVAKVDGCEHGTADASVAPAMTRSQCAAGAAPGRAAAAPHCRAMRCCWARWASATPRPRRC